MRRLVTAALTAAVALTLTSANAPTHAAHADPGGPAGAAAPLVNLSHLDWLRDAVTPPAQAGHTTYRLDRDPAVGVLWTYADRAADGSYRRIGGGTYDPAADRYGQGAYNADDISRAAVVYLRHWRATGAAASRTAAYQLLRGLTYLQTATGPDAGNVILWMQPDGSLNPSADPPELPDPSDSGDSYWLARTIWALGEGHAAFRATDPAFAAFLAARLHLAIGAVERQPLSRYGEWLRIDGARVPAWLIAEGADATGEALLGLSAYVAATGDARARTVLDRLTEGVVAMRAGDARTWPYGAVLPWARSQAMWHGWGGLAPAGLAAAYRSGAGGARARDAALSDAASFTSHLLIAAGPENGWLPAPTDRTQIAYGAQSRVESVLRAADAGGRPGLAALAGVAAAWFFGNNPAGTPMYDPATGRTYDGVDGAGTVNRNAGAESTIHGLLAMLDLDARPDVAAVARAATVRDRHTWRLVEAEDGDLTGDAAVHRPAAAWTGESLWSNGAGVRLGPGGRLHLPVSTVEPTVVMPVVELSPGAGVTRWDNGTVRHGDTGPQGDSPAPGLLAVRTLPATAPAQAVTVTGTAGTALVDAVLLQPELEWLVLGGTGTSTALVRSFAASPRTTALTLPHRTTVTVYDASGRLVSQHPAHTGTVRITVPGGGFAIATT